MALIALLGVLFILLSFLRRSIVKGKTELCQNDTEDLYAILRPLNLPFNLRYIKEDEIEEFVRVMELSGVCTIAADKMTSLYKYDPMGFCVAVSEKNKIIGTCLSIINTEQNGMIGGLSVQTEVHQLEVQGKLLSLSFYHLGNRQVEFNAPKNFNQHTSKFSFEAHWTIHTYTADVSQLNVWKFIECQPVYSLEELSQENYESLVDYDKELCEFDRKTLISKLLWNAEITYLLREQTQIIGYGSIFKSSGNQWILGPVYAPDIYAAGYLIRKLFTKMKSVWQPSDKIIAYVLDSNKWIAAFLSATCFVQTSEEWLRKRSNYQTDATIHRVFVLSTLLFTSF